MFNNIFRRLFSKKEKQNIHLEEAYKTTITKENVTVEHPKRPLELINWDEIEEILLVNTDEGPFLPDVWLILSGGDKGCSLPQGSDGFEKVFDIVSKYEGFDFENFIQSMSCTDSKSFILWKKK